MVFSGRYDEGIAEALSAVELDPESLLTHFILQSSYAFAGWYPEAIAGRRPA